MTGNAMSRRHLLQYGAAAATVPLMGLPEAVPAEAVPLRAVPFRLDQVALRPSVFTEKRDRLLAYARAYPADRILSNFRAAAGLDTRGAAPPGGWDDATGNLRGHYSGHFLSMLAQAWASSGERVFNDKLDYIVAGLKECQDAWAARVGQPGGVPGPSRAGFLAAYPETQFIQLEQYVTYPTIWAPYYTCHKIMRGLLDAHTLAGNATALTVARGMGEWVHSRLGHLPRAQLDRMWSLYIAGEYGGMNEIMADLHALTGNPTFLQTARCFDNTALLADCVAGVDSLDGRHANQHIPQFLGYLRLFEESGETRYRTAAANFFDMVVPHRTYAHGGTGQGEIFRKRDVIAGSIVDTTNAETCAAYNMMKLARGLFFHTPHARYLDYHEKALVNQILASRRDANSTEDPLVTYMVPVGPGVRRGYGNIGTCCGGTGLENHTKYQDTIYFRSPADDTLYVNLFIPSTLRWESRGLTITQTGDFPRTDSSVLTVTGSGRFDLRLRVPSWATLALTLNGRPHPTTPGPDGYVSIARTWQPGDRVEIRFPYRLRTTPTVDDPSLQSLSYGPVALIAKSSRTDRLPLPADPVTTARPGPRPLTFLVGDILFEPFFLGDQAAYHAYFRRS